MLALLGLVVMVGLGAVVVVLARDELTSECWRCQNSDDGWCRCRWLFGDHR